MDLLKNEVNKIKWNPNKKEWLPSGCCYLDKLKSCYEKAMDPYCNQDGKKYMRWCAESYYADFIDMACPTSSSDFTGSKCKSLSKKLSKIIKSNPAAKNDPEPHSVFVPLYKLLLEFGDITQDIFQDAIRSTHDSPDTTSHPQ